MPITNIITFFRHDSNESELEIMASVNKYAQQHGLAFEGRFDGKRGNDGSVFFKPCTFTDYLPFRQNDNVSHFICRLAYCRNEELRKWFLTQETRLF